ncbi:MAG: hypothetical protein U1F46_16485 [Marinagarivorans sp.]
MPLDELLDELDELELEEELELELLLAAGAEFLFLFPPQPVRERPISIDSRKGRREAANIERSSVGEIKKRRIVEGWPCEGQFIPKGLAKYSVA